MSQDHIPNDPFDKLFDTSGLEDKNELIANIIYPYLRFTSMEDPEIRFTPVGEKTTAANKILTFLLAKKVLVIKGLIPLESMTPAEIERETGISGGTVRPTLKRLTDLKFIRQSNDGGGYFVPDGRIRQIELFLKDKSDAPTN